MKVLTKILNRSVPQILLLPLLISHVIMDKADCANILVYGAVGTHSTRISMFPLMEALANAGHQVTFLSAYDNFEDPDNLSPISYYTPPKWKQAMGSWEDHFPFFEIRKQGKIPWLWFNTDMGVLSCRTLYSDPEFVNWVKTSTFDLVIMESIVNECAYGLVHHFGAKLVIYSTTTMMPWFPDSYGFADESSAVSDVIWGFPGGDRMSFWERMKNALTPIVFNVNREYVYFPELENITRRGLGLGEIPSFREIERNASLVLLTTHYSVDVPRSLPPHVVTIGGAVVGGKGAKTMPKKMEDYLNSGDQGFIFISFGTLAEFTKFDREVQVEFIRALSSFPEIKFLWKASVQMNDTLPGNVKLTKWAPQQTILGHPKIRAFITHCGMGSTTEAVHFGVPMILLPVLAEQDANANAIESKGAGIKLEITTLKKLELVHAISEILNNEKYRTSMKKLSESFKDRPAQPVETGVWWIEYILRHPNSNDYLVPISVRQPWWKRRQIDVWITVAAALSIFAYLSMFPFIILFRIVKAVFRKIFGPKNPPYRLKYNTP